MKNIVLLAALLFAVSCQSFSLRKSASFDFFIFVQEWNPNITQDYFTIHGLWPQNNNGSYPAYCGGPNFTTTAISDLLSTMDLVWPSDTGNNTDFWSHEWDKHGSCSGYDEHTFFQTVINLHAKFNVLAALAQSNITPGGNNKFDRDAVQDAIHTNIGSYPSLNCNRTALSELGLCVTQSLSLQDCPTNMGDFWNCPDKFYFN